MDKFVHVPSEEVCVAVESENAQRGGVGKSAVTVEIDPVYALPSRIQQQLSNFAGVVEKAGQFAPYWRAILTTQTEKPAVDISPEL